MIGQRLAHFRITAKLGEGGMGEVYRAEDTKLGREVAIKVLPEAFVEDRERLARFEREAKVLASLNHPNIAGIYEVGSQLAETGSDGELHYLVMELAPGETLAERIARGPVPIDEAIPLSLQLADALAAAHERGIVHRDLKPANVKVDAEGRVKVLDFGLAKAFTPEMGDSSVSAIAASPTLTHQATLAGVLMGTAGYMSPEQARGRAVDTRSDIWAFGVVLWEMLTGERLFLGPSVTDTLAAIVRAEPEWSQLPAATPRALRRLLRRCLEKDARKRLHHIADARLELEAGREEEATPVAASAGGVGRRELVAWGLAVAALLAAAGAWVGRPAGPGATPARAVRLRATLPPPPGTGFNLLGDFAGSPVLSPDGRQMVFAAVDPDGQSRLRVRPLDSLETRVLPETEQAYFPFWSPDGRSLAFFVAGTLQRIDLDGGPPRQLAGEAQGLSTDCKGGAWGPDGTIVFSGGPTGEILRVPASGGTPEPLTVRDAALHTTHRFPHFLPDGRRFVFLAANHYDLTAATSGLYIASLDDGEPRQLIATNAEGTYASGYLLTVDQGVLTARTFDLERGDVGPPQPTREQVQVDPTTWKSAFSVSDDGLLVYAAGGELTGSMARWFDAEGTPGPMIAEAANIQNLALSPDGSKVAVESQNEAPTSDLWTYDLEHGSRLRLTFGAAQEGSPVWSSDGRTIFFSASNLQSVYSIFRKPASGAGNEERLVAVESDDVWPLDASRGGRYLAFARGPYLTRTAASVWLLDLEAGGEPARLALNDEGKVGSLRFSPDGRFLAYSSDASGRNEIYITPFTPPGGDGAPPPKWQVSSDGGDQPRWRADGRKLYYLALDNTIVAVDVDFSGGAPEIRGERRLFRALQRGDTASYDVSADGERFVLNTLAGNATRPLRVVVDWPAQLTGPR